MTETQKDLAMLLMNCTTKESIIKGIVLFLQKEQQQIQMIQYLIQNKNNKLTEEQITKKAMELMKA